MARKCYISFKWEDREFKRIIQEDLNIDMVDKSLNERIDSDDPDYIMQKIREEYLCDSTVTIHLIGSNSYENAVWEDQTFIKRELQASLYNGKGNTRNGILGLVLPTMYSTIYRGSGTCAGCGNPISYVHIDDNSTIKEFSINYHIPGKCHWGDDDRYCVMVKWDEFIVNPEKYIEETYEKRFTQIANKVTVYPK